MGLNAFFTYTVCFGLGFEWQEAMVMVFICGLINVAITVTKVRKHIIKAIPESLQLAIGGGIGLFIAYIGIKNAGFLNFVDTAEGFSLGAKVVPSLADFGSKGAWVALFGLLLIAILMIKKVKGAIFIGIIASTILALAIGFVPLPETGTLFSNKIGAVKEVWFPQLFKEYGFRSLFSNPDNILKIIMVIFAFSLSDTFDTIGTFIGTGRKTGIFDAEDERALTESNGFKSKMDKALFADSVATSIGAMAGTSNTTTYVESAAGINVGGKTGFASLITALMFVLCLPFATLFGLVPAEATAPALIIVVTREHYFDFGLAFEIEDYAAAVENLLLAITAMGYASCWFDGMARSDGRDKALAQILGIPKDRQVRCVLPVGVPEEMKPQAARKPFEDRVDWRG